MKFNTTMLMIVWLLVAFVLAIAAAINGWHWGWYAPLGAFVAFGVVAEVNYFLKRRKGR